MNLSLLRRLTGHLLVWSLVSVLAFGLTGCGGGGGSDDEDDGGPAPMTFNGLVLTLYAGGVQLTFIRSEGDASKGAETGAVTMVPSPGSTSLVDSSGAARQLRPSNAISGGRYTYVRTGPEAGTITITGEGTGIFQQEVFPQPPANYFRGGAFTRQYEVLFGTDGVNLTGIDVNDWGEGSTYPGISWKGANIRVFGGALVAYGWSLEDSELVNLPKLYPTSVSTEQLVVTPTNTAENAYRFEFLTSTFTRFSDAEGDFLEQGVGRSQIVPDPTLSIINYDYQPDPATTNRAVIRIYFETGLPYVYNMTFLDLEKGTYVREDGSTGAFEFPFLEQ